MEGYKKKLLARYPENEKKTVKDGPAGEPPVKDVEFLRQALHSELEKDIRSLQGEIARKKKAPAGFWFLLLFLAVVAAAAAGWGTVFWLERHLRPDVDRELESIREYAAGKMDTAFSSDRIQSVIETEVKRYTRDKVEALVESRAGRVLDPWQEKIREWTTRMREESQEALQNLEAVTEVMVLEARAGNDDRRAFEKLLAISRNKRHVYREAAGAAVEKIYARVNTLHRSVVDIQDPAQNESVSRLPYKAFKKLYEQTIPLYRPWLLTELWESRHFSEYEKLDFLADVIRNDTSLAALERACRLMDFETHLNKPLTAYDFYLTWWADHQDVYKKVGGAT